MAELYSLPDGWEWKKLGKIAKLQNGFAFKSKLFVNDGLPIVRIKNIKNEKVLLDDVVYFNVEDYGKKLDSYQIKKNDILIAMSGATTGKIGLYDTEEISYLNQRVGLFRIENSNLRSYLFYFLSTQIEKNLELSLGAAQPNLSTEQINNIELPLPPLEEQKRIVAKLDILFAKIDKAIDLHQKNIDEADIFMASVLNDVFVELEEKYEKFNINKIATVKGGKRVPKGYTLSEEVTPYPYLRVTDFKDYGTICTKKMLYLTEEVHEQIKRYTITDEDLYITNVGNTIGKSGIIPSELNGANLTENAVKLVYKDKKNTSNKFMYYFTKTSIFLIQLESATMQMAVPKLAIMRLGEIELPFPPIETQQKVVSYLDEISEKMEKIKNLQKDKMQSLKELKASILDKAFKGEL